MGIISIFLTRASCHGTIATIIIIIINIIITNAIIVMVMISIFLIGEQTHLIARASCGGAMCCVVRKQTEREVNPELKRQKIGRQTLQIRIHRQLFNVKLYF